MSTVFVDTSGWIALLSADDRLHRPALSRYEELSRQGSRLLTNNYVVDETATHLRYRLGLDAALGFHRMLLAAVETRRLRIAWIDQRPEAEAWQILEQYADVKLSLTDAACAVTARGARITEVYGSPRSLGATATLDARLRRPGRPSLLTVPVTELDQLLTVGRHQ